MSETIEPGTALAVIPAASLPTILAADETDIFGKLFAELNGFRGDPSTERGRKEIVSKAAKVSTAKQDLLRLGKRLKEDHLRIQKSIVAEERVIEDRFDKLRDQVRAPVTEYENREKQRVENHEAGIRFIETWTDIPEDATSEQIADHIARVRIHDCVTRDWQEFKAKAEDGIARSLNALERRYRETAKREADARELARLQAEEAERQRLAAIETQRQRDEQIAAAAAERATREAEERAAREAKEAEDKAQAALKAQALAAEELRAAGLRREIEAAEALARVEREKQAAVEKAERDRVEAAKKAKAETDAAIEAERQRVAREAAARKAEDDRRAADKAHRGQINREALTVLTGALMGVEGTSREEAEVFARVCVEVIARGMIPNIIIQY